MKYDFKLTQRYTKDGSLAGGRIGLTLCEALERAPTYREWMDALGDETYRETVKAHYGNLVICTADRNEVVIWEEGQFVVSEQVTQILAATLVLEEQARLESKKLVRRLDELTYPGLYPPKKALPISLPASAPEA